jgi:hypothetical protein
MGWLDSSTNFGEHHAMTEQEENDWNEWWDARLAAMTNVLGRPDDVVGHAAVPFGMGADLGGAADIVYFRDHVPGIVAATSELIGNEDQIESSLGNYELLICQRNDIEWGANLISRLACYTLDVPLQPGETMDIGSAVPAGSTIAALLFCEYAEFRVRDRRAGLLLCIGITQAELVLRPDGCDHEGLARGIEI